MKRRLELKAADAEIKTAVSVQLDVKYRTRHEVERISDNLRNHIFQMLRNQGFNVSEIKVIK